MFSPSVLPAFCFLTYHGVAKAMQFSFYQEWRFPKPFNFTLCKSHWPGWDDMLFFFSQSLTKATGVTKNSSAYLKSLQHRFCYNCFYPGDVYMQNPGPNGIILKLKKYSNWPSKSVDSSCRMSAKCRFKKKY